jgi:hypothetical protein
MTDNLQQRTCCRWLRPLAVSYAQQRLLMQGTGIFLVLEACTCALADQ